MTEVTLDRKDDISNQKTENLSRSTGDTNGHFDTDIIDSKFDDLLQYNDGLKTKLIGTAEQVAERIVFLKSLGASIILCAFLHYEDDIEAFGKTVLPLVRKLEAEGRGKSEEHEVGISGDIYRARITGEKTVV